MDIWKRQCARPRCAAALRNPKKDRFCSRECLNADARDRMREKRKCERPGCLETKRTGSKFCGNACLDAVYRGQRERAASMAPIKAVAHVVSAKAAKAK
jgi:hypothetical protein